MGKNNPENPDFCPWPPRRLASSFPAISALDPVYEPSLLGSRSECPWRAPVESGVPLRPPRAGFRGRGIDHPVLDAALAQPGGDRDVPLPALRPPLAPLAGGRADRGHRHPSLPRRAVGPEPPR